jgi:hypothetical protein
MWLCISEISDPNEIDESLHEVIVESDVGRTASTTRTEKPLLRARCRRG